jgi:hypothetical protein
MTKITQAREVLLAMSFFGIPAHMFAELKKQHGSLAALHTYLANKF